jgi:hypothetical protein
MILRNGGSLGGAIYLIVGIILAATHGYFTALGSLSSILSALLAVVLWPALLFGANFHLSFGV